MKHKDQNQSDYSRAIRKSATGAIISCSLWWGLSTFAMIIGAFVFLTDSAGIAIAALLYAVLLLIPIFKHNLLRTRSFEGTIVHIDSKRRYEIYITKPQANESAFQYRSEYTLLIQEDSGKHRSVSYRFKESSRPFVYQEGDRVRYRWGIPYMEILSSKEKHSVICPFCGKELPFNAVDCPDCNRSFGQTDGST